MDIHINYVTISKSDSELVKKFKNKRIDKILCYVHIIVYFSVKFKLKPFGNYFKGNFNFYIFGDIIK